MSTALAIAAVTATLQTSLQDVFNSQEAQGALPSIQVTVSSIAPDLVQKKLFSTESYYGVNLFLHQVTPNTAWRNVALPSLGADGSTRLTNPPLALDLHYLLTTYAPDDFHAEALLGFGVQLLHEHPVLTRAHIRKTLNNLNLTNNPLSAVLKNSQLAMQMEMVKITPSHWRKNSNWANLCIAISDAHFSRHASMLRGSRRRNPVSHSDQTASPCAALPAMNNE